MAAPTVSTAPVARLRPDDLKFAPGGSAPKRLHCRLLAVDLRHTQQGQSWALLDLAWRAHRLRAAVFPSQWQALRAVRELQVGERYVIIGSVRFSDGIPSLNVHELHQPALRLVPSA
ncbi:MAG: hypothetical protein ACJ714_00365 [Ornithinibacter sp.]